MAQLAFDIQPTRLGEIAENYDALFCDVWGVLHDGTRAFETAVEALQQFRKTNGPVILITNAPVPVERVTGLFPKFDVPMDCFDAVATSGDAARAVLAKEATGPVYRIGPPYDEPLYHGLELSFTEDPEQAVLVSCTGLRRFDKNFRQERDEHPDLYLEELQRLVDLELPMICANPDLIYRHGEELVWAAGALAQRYEKLGGRVTRPGKPDDAIYDLARSLLSGLTTKPVPNARILAIGDGPATDLKGAVNQDMDCLFVAGGIHGEALEDGEGFLDDVRALLNEEKAVARYVMPVLSW